jgi:GDP-L-fucose synthase
LKGIILAGGSGTRLWPISRTIMPKQFVKLFGNKSLFQLTFKRNAKLCDSQFIVSNAEQYFLAIDQLEEVQKENNKYLLEPNNIIYQSYFNGVKKLLFLGSTCIYPKNAPQPMKEEYLLTSELEYTNEPYAIAKIAGIKMCESYNIQYGTNFISVMPTNLYGPNDNFDLEKSHVLPALIRKIHLAKLLNEKKYNEVVEDLQLKNIEEAKEYLKKFGVDENRVEIWGSGKPRREFLYSEDMADACVFLLENRDFKDTYNHNNKEIRNTHINIGTGKDISIKELAEVIKDIIGFKGYLYFNTDKPDGTMIKLTDPSKLHALGWKHKVELEDGIRKIYKWYLRTYKR